MTMWEIPSRRRELSRYFTGTETQLTAETGEAPIDDTAAAVRRIVDALARTAPRGEHLPGVTTELSRIADLLEARTDPVQDRLTDIWEGDGVARHDPATGPENPIAPPLILRVAEEGWVEGVVELGLPYQGPPGNVHGGICAMLLDAALAVANHRAGTNGMTAQLNIRYQRPTPVCTPITVRAKQLRAEGRKRFTVGELVVDGRVTASAEGLFIARKDRVVKTE